MNVKIYVSALITVSIFSSASFGQNTWNNVYTILNTNCTSIIGGCHEHGSSNPSFDVEGTPSQLYAQIINGNPSNPYAKDVALNKLIVPFSPQTSFMMRKLSHCGTVTFGTNALALKQPNEGATMPQGGSRLPDADVELIYNWILQGASETDAIVPDTVAGDICDLNVGIRTLPDVNIAFSAYPNPASENFSCTYRLDASSFVTIQLLDVTGRNVKTLFSENQTMGMQVKTISPEVNAGIYFIRLTIGNSAQYMKKIALH